MQEQLELSLPAGVHFTERALILPPGLTQEQWLDVGRYLSKARGALAFWIADWHGFGRREFGDDQVREGISKLQFEFSDLLSVEKLNAVTERFNGLTAEHHFVLSTVGLFEQKMWGEIAEREELSPQELQLSVKAGVVTRIKVDPNARQAGGVSTFNGIRIQSGMLRRQIGDQWEKWKPGTREEAIEEVRWIVLFWSEFINQIDQSGGVSTVHVVRMQWDLLRKQIGDQWVDWTPATRETFMEELRPIIDFWDALVAQMDQAEESKE